MIRTEYGLRLDHGPEGGDIIPIDDRRGDRLEAVAKAGRPVTVNGMPATLMVRMIRVGEWGEVVALRPESRVGAYDALVEHDEPADPPFRFGGVK